MANGDAVIADHHFLNKQSRDSLSFAYVERLNISA
jgi:hypothetical protein